MEQLNQDTIKRELLRLANHYPEAGHNGKTISLLSRDFLEDLTDEHVSAREFNEAIKVVRRRCKFFPKMSEILEVIGEIRRRQPLRKTQQIDYNPESLSDEEATRKFQIIRNQLANKLSADEATKRIVMA